MSSSNWHVFFIWKQENSYWGFVDYAAILFGGTTFPQDKNTYLALFGESMSSNYLWCRSCQGA